MNSSARLFVFDLDFTLWDAGGTWCDHTDPPYRLKKGEVYDSRGRHITLYPDIYRIFDLLDKYSLQRAAASRTHAPQYALKLLELFGLKERFTHMEIYPGSKIPHFQKLREKSGYDFEEMVFFDDEARNIEDISGLGVRTVHTPRGLSMEKIEPFFKERGGRRQEA